MMAKIAHIIVIIADLFFCVSVEALESKYCLSRKESILEGAAGIAWSSLLLCSASPESCLAVVAPDEGTTGAVAKTSASSLISMIPRMEFGAPATNATIHPKLATEIEAMAISLESQKGSTNLAKSPNLSGSWRLLYSNGPEITNLAGSLPLGFSLGPTYQPLDTATGRFENRGSVLNRIFNLAKLETNVIGDVSISEPNTLNAIGIRNDKGNRVNVDFRAIVFQLDEVLGIPLKNPVRKILIPTLDPNAAQPANDITYLDQTTRIVRGGDGALFIFRREESGTPILTISERNLLIQGATNNNKNNATNNTAVVGIGGASKAEGSSQPELKFLFKNDNK